MPFDLSRFDPAPKRIQQSPFLAADDIGEATLGTIGAIAVPQVCMVVRGSQFQIEDGLWQTAFWGSFLYHVDPTGHDKKLQMWYGAMHFLPEVKFRDGFEWKRADQILCGPFSRPEMWKELILDNT